MAGVSEAETGLLERDASGINGDLETWLSRNLPRDGVWARDGEIAPRPPVELMYPTTGLTDPAHFASHGVDFMRALSALSPVALRDYKAVLDFGVGVGRVARLFHGFRGRYVGVDVDAANIAWLKGHLKHVEAVLTAPRERLPLADRSFDAVISISVFSHLSEPDQLFYLDELARVTMPGAILMLSIHGNRALERALAEPAIFDMLCIPRDRLEAIKADFVRGNGYAFIRQDGHLTSETYDYGMTFISATHIEAEWTKRFELLEIGTGSLHDFQDVVVLKAR